MAEDLKQMSLEEYAEFSSAVLRELPRDIDPAVARKWCKSRKLLRTQLSGLFKPESLEAFGGYLEHKVDVQGGAYASFEPQKYFGHESSEVAGVLLLGQNNPWVMGLQYESPVKDIASAKIRLFQIQKEASINAVYKELGGRDRCVISIAHLYDVLAWKLANNDHHALFACIPDDDGSTHQIYVRWYVGRGWRTHSGFSVPGRGSIGSEVAVY